MASTGTETTLMANGETGSISTIGPMRLSLTGDFGSGTAQFQAKSPNGVWVDVANGSFTAATDTLFDFPVRSETDVRVKLTGATNPALRVWFQGDAAYH